MLQRCKVGLGGGIEAETRTCSYVDVSVHVLPSREKSILERTISRAASVFDIPRGQIEYGSCVRYRPGQEFKYHQDTFTGHWTTLSRRWSMVIALTTLEVSHGGATKFLQYPAASTQPVQGRALCWLNTIDRTSTEVDPRSVHSGSMLSEGAPDKWILTFWGRDSPNW